MRWVKLLLIDAPAFVIGTWLRLYALVLAVVVTVFWAGIIVLLAQAACRAVGVR